jgi:hypothetical protein
MISGVRICEDCALVTSTGSLVCPACRGWTRWMDGAPEPREDRALGTIPGAVPLLLALLVVTLAAMGLRRCEVAEPDVEDEHAAPSFTRALVKEPATFPTVIPDDRCDRGFAPKLDGVLPAMEPNS